MIEFAWLSSLFAIGMVATLATTSTSGVETLNLSAARMSVAPVLMRAQTGTEVGSCRADLSVESIELRKSGPTGPTSIRMVVKNTGTESFSTTPVFAKAMIEMQNGATGAVTQHPAGNIVLIRPGQSQQLSVTLRRAVFDTFMPQRNSAGSVRASVNFSPNAPRCGIDPNSENDQLIATHEQVRDWLSGVQPFVFVRR